MRSASHAGPSDRPDPPAWEDRPLGESQRHPAQSQDSDPQNHDAQVQTYPTYAEGWNDAPEQFHRGIRARVDQFEADSGDADRAPRPGELTGDLNHDSCDDQ